MAEIKRVTIENFQSHENTTLEFHPGMNVIVGPSDMGKSAVMRALKWVLYNEPRGIEFIRQGTTTARVTLEMSNGYTILRERSKSKNKYVVTQPDGASIQLEGFGNEVPQEVIDAHGIPRVLLDNELRASLNLGEQLEGPFLLSETGAMKAKAIGRLSGVHIMDQAIRDVLTDLKREKQNEERTRRELETVSEKLEAYAGLEAMKERLEKAQILLAALNEKSARMQKLREAKDRLDGFQKERAALESLLQRLRRLNESEQFLLGAERILIKLNALERFQKKMRENGNEIERTGLALQTVQGTERIAGMVRQAEEGIQRRQKLLQVYEKNRSIQGEIQKVQPYLNATRHVEACGETVALLEEKFRRSMKLAELKIQLEEKNKGMKEGEAFIKNTRLGMESLSREYAGLLRKAGKCPICASDIDDMKIEDILKHHLEEE